MIDGTQKGTGNSRYLKSVSNLLTLYPTYADFVAALVEGTFPIDLNGINSSGWTQLGTPFTKANLLSDAVSSAIFGDSDDHTVNEAFSSVNTKINNINDIIDVIYQVGHILSTMRTDLSDDWLLCDGSSFSQTTYRGLSSFLPAYPNSTFESISSSHSFNSVAYGNGYWVATGNSGTYYATNPFSTWTWVTGYIGNSITYENGYWVIVSYSGDLYYATDPTGTWTTKKVTSESLYGIAYGNGYWVAVGDNGMTTGTGTLYYATNLSGTWVRNAQSNARFRDVIYGNGYWVAVGVNGIVYHTTNPTGAWTHYLFGSYDTFENVIYANGYWVTVGENGDVNYSSNLSSWNSANFTSEHLYGIFYGNGYWVAVGENGTLYYATDLTGTWTSNTQGTSDFYGVYNNGIDVIVVGSYSIYGADHFLPTVSIGAYSYIKGK